MSEITSVVVPTSLSKTSWSETKKNPDFKSVTGLQYINGKRQKISFYENFRFCLGGMGFWKDKRGSNEPKVTLFTIRAEFLASRLNVTINERNLMFKKKLRPERSPAARRCACIFFLYHYVTFCIHINWDNWKPLILLPNQSY